MCYHRLYIFTTCGHSFWQPGPLLRCADASFPSPSSSFPSSSSAFFSTTCEPRSHPFQTRKLYTLCWHCGRRRDALLAQAELQVGREEVRFEEWKWRMKYQSPQADENAWRTWGSGSVGVGREASGGAGGKRSSTGRMRRMSDIIKSGLRKSSGSGGGGGGGGGVEKK